MIARAKVTEPPVEECRLECWPLCEEREHLDCCELQEATVGICPHAVTAGLLIVAAVIFHLSGLASMPSPWAWV